MKVFVQEDGLVFGQKNKFSLYKSLRFERFIVNWLSLSNLIDSMRKLGLYLYLTWAVFWGALVFVLMYPLILICIQRPGWHRFYHGLSKVWAWTFYRLALLRVRSRWEFKPERGQVYVFCSNHFSYLDIPLLTLAVPSFTVFVGLHDLNRIPLFGYMFRKIHIPIDRSSPRSRYLTYQRAKDALAAGKSVAIFPEGGIWATDFPHMAPFKDGAFRMAIEQGVSIVPVTIPHNWRMMPLMNLNKFKRVRSEVIFHQPIPTKGLRLEDVPRLKAQVFEVIDQQLQQYFPEAYVHE
jgi:1-acyl-sn-glycerol-3-phosphate acyltransferase